MSATEPHVPVAKKVIVGFLLAAVAAVIQQVVPGYSPDAIVQQGIDIVVGLGAAYIVKEEARYLVPALERINRQGA